MRLPRSPIRLRRCGCYTDPRAGGRELIELLNEPWSATLDQMINKEPEA